MATQPLEQGDSDTTSNGHELIPGVPQLMLPDRLVLAGTRGPGTTTRGVKVRTIQGRRGLEIGPSATPFQNGVLSCNARLQSWFALLASPPNPFSARTFFRIDHSFPQIDALIHLPFKTGGGCLLPADTPKKQWTAMAGLMLKEVKQPGQLEEVFLMF